MKLLNLFTGIILYCLLDDDPTDTSITEYSIEEYSYEDQLYLNTCYQEELELQSLLKAWLLF